jgi:hypothetical protein
MPSSVETIFVKFPNNNEGFDNLGYVFGR